MILFIRLLFPLLSLAVRSETLIEAECKKSDRADLLCALLEMKEPK